MALDKRGPTVRDEIGEEAHALVGLDTSPLMGDAFSATIGGSDDDLVVRLSGELDMATAPELTRVMEPFIERGPNDVVVDLSALTFIDSSGVTVLLDAQHRLTEGGRRLVVRSPQRNARKVFEIAGLLEYLNVVTENEGSPTTPSA